MATEQQPHFLLIPYSEQGHLNPMLGLASHLLRLRCRVTLVKANRHLRPPSISDEAGAAVGAEPESGPPHAAPSAGDSTSSTAAAHEEGQQLIRVVTLPVRNKALCVDVNTMTRFQIFKNTMAGLEERQDLIAAIIEESKASAHPVTGIICDHLLWKWVRHLARAYPDLRSAVFCIFSALTFYTHYLSTQDKDKQIEEILVSHLGMPSTKDGTTYFGLANMKDSLELKLQKHIYFSSFYEGIEEAKTVLINSFEALEAPLVPLLQALHLDVLFIGPCISKWHNNDGSRMVNMEQQVGDIFKEDITCLTWLDQQEKGSVLFVSFGSEGEVSTKQLEEINLGIKISGHNFLWVMRPNALENSKLMQTFCEQRNCQSKGIVVSWAPQKKVLQHSAMGGFLTHSGWNSTLESLTSGVPMICLPLLGDQPYIASFVQDYLQVGLRLNVSKDGLVHKEEVAYGVQVVMQGRFSQNVSKFEFLAQLAFAKAYANLEQFVEAKK